MGRLENSIIDLLSIKSKNRHALNLTYNRTTELFQLISQSAFTKEQNFDRTYKITEDEELRKLLNEMWLYNTAKRVLKIRILEFLGNTLTFENEVTYIYFSKTNPLHYNYIRTSKSIEEVKKFLNGHTVELLNFDLV